MIFVLFVVILFVNLQKKKKQQNLQWKYFIIIIAKTVVLQYFKYVFSLKIQHIIECKLFIYLFCIWSKFI